MPQPGTSSTWTSQEDELLRELVNQHGSTKWTKIALDLGTKGSKQCRRRWKNYLCIDDAHRNVGSWTPEEDEVLLEGHRLHGNKWTEIAKELAGRTDNAVKNRWHALKKTRTSGNKRSRRTCEPSDDSSLGYDIDADIARSQVEGDSDETPASKRCRADHAAHARLPREQVLFCFHEHAVASEDRQELLGISNTPAPVRFFQKDSQAAADASFQCYVPANEPKRAAQDVIMWLKGGGVTSEQCSRLWSSAQKHQPTAEQRAAMKRLFSSYRRDPAAVSLASPRQERVDDADADGSSLLALTRSDGPQEIPQPAEVSSKICLETFLALLIDACTIKECSPIAVDALLPLPAD
jgi:hypothetical protein